MKILLSRLFFDVQFVMLTPALLMFTISLLQHRESFDEVNFRLPGATREGRGVHHSTGLFKSYNCQGLPAKVRPDTIKNCSL